MDDSRRAVLLAELEDAKKERDQLNSFISVMSARLGIAADDDSAESASDNSANPAAGGAGGQLTDDPMSLVYANEFFGMTMPKAAETLLLRWSPEPYHRPLKTTDLVRALNKGGLDIKEPRVLYRSLYATARFKNLRGGQWGLSKWYPNGVVPRRGKGSDDMDEQGVSDIVGDESPTRDVPADDGAGDAAPEDAGSP